MSTLLYVLATAIGTTIICRLCKKGKNRTSQESVPFKVPRGIWLIYEEIKPRNSLAGDQFGGVLNSSVSDLLFPDHIQGWLQSKHRWDDQKVYRQAKNCFLEAINRQCLPPDWTQKALAGFILEYQTMAVTKGLIAGQRAFNLRERTGWDI